MILLKKKSKTISIDGVIDGLTQDDVEPVMEGLIGGVLVSDSSLVDEASIVETTTEEIFNLIEN